MGRLEEIEELISQLTTEKRELEQEHASRELERLRERHGVQVVCPDCCGSGEIAGHDFLDGPSSCAWCDGNGYLWAVRYVAGTCYASMQELVEAVSELHRR